LGQAFEYFGAEEDEMPLGYDEPEIKLFDQLWKENLGRIDMSPTQRDECVCNLASKLEFVYKTEVDGETKYISPYSMNFIDFG